METHEALSLVVFYLGAFGAPLLAGRVRIPAAVGEILFGLLVGQSGLHLVHPTAFTDFLAKLGFIFLMFLVGMEIDFNRIKREGLRGLLLAGSVAVAIFVLAAGVTRWLRWPAFLALVLGAMSVGILMVTLVESRLHRSRFGQVLLLVGSIGEFLSLFGMTGYNLTARFGIGSRLYLAVMRSLLLFVGAYVLLSLLRLLVWWAPHRFQRLVDQADPSEIGVRAGFMLMLLLAALAGLLGIEGILGSFLAGALFSFVFREKGVLETKLAALGQGFFVPIFFINVGIGFNASALPAWAALLKIVAGLLLASLLVKMVPALLLLLAGLRLREVVAGGFLLSSPLTLLVAVTALGTDLKIIDPGTGSAILLIAIVTGVAYPICFKRLMR